MRRCHYIKPNHRSETPTRAIWLSLDIQSERMPDSSLRHYWNTGTVITGIKNAKTGTWFTRQYEITEARQLWEILDTVVKTKTRTYLIVNNSDLTLTLLETWNWLTVYDWKIKLLVIACPPCIVNLRRKQATVTILDVSNIWPQLSTDISSGENLGGSSEIQQGNAPSPKGKLSAAIADMMQRMFTEWWTFLKANDLGGFSPTIGAQSFRVWRHRFMTNKVLIDLHDDALALARKGLFGGRCECFKVGSFEGLFYQVDINSSYAHVMRDMRVPCKLLGYTEHTTTKEINGWIDDYVVVADVELETDTPAFPYRRDGRLTFPVGNFRTVLCGSELYDGLARGCIRSVYRACVYECSRAFEQYMGQLWDYRTACEKAGNLVDAGRWKLLMASFFGKWAQKGGFWENVDTTTDSRFLHWLDVDYSSGAVTHFRQIAGVIQQRSSETEAAQSHPAIAACVTAGGRLNLWRLIERAGLDNVYYVDTDSLLLNAVGFGRVYNDSRNRELGGLKLQGTYERIQVFSPKHYRVNGQERFSGIRKTGTVRHGRVCVQDEIVSIETQIRLGGPSRAYSRRVRKEFSHDVD